MKAFITLALALSASTAMASLSKTSSWAQIFASDATLVFEENLGGIALNNACLTANEVKTIKPAKVCAKLVPVETKDDGMTHTDWVCKQWAMSHLAVSRTSTVSKCAEYSNHGEVMECVRYESSRSTVPATINVSVVEESYGEGGNGHAFTKQYTFPACK